MKDHGPQPPGPKVFGWEVTVTMNPKKIHGGAAEQCDAETVASAAHRARDKRPGSPGGQPGPAGVLAKPDREPASVVKTNLAGRGPVEESGGVQASVAVQRTNSAPGHVQDSSNQFFVGANLSGFVVFWLGPETTRQQIVLTADRALNLGAWLCLMADPSGKETERLMKAIKST